MSSGALRMVLQAQDAGQTAGLRDAELGKAPDPDADGWPVDALAGMVYRQAYWQAYGSYKGEPPADDSDTKAQE